MKVKSLLSKIKNCLHATELLCPLLYHPFKLNITIYYWYMLQLLPKKIIFFQEISYGIQYTNPQSVTLQITVFWDRYDIHNCYPLCKMYVEGYMYVGHLTICISIYISICISIYPSIYLSIYLSIYISI